MSVLCVIYFHLFPCHWWVWAWILQRSSTHSRVLHKSHWDTFWLWHQQGSGLWAAASHNSAGGAYCPRRGNKLAPVARERGCGRSAAACVCALLARFCARYLWPLVGFSDADHVSEAVLLVAMVPGDVVKVFRVRHLNFRRSLRFHCASARSYDFISSAEMTNTEILNRIIISFPYPHHTGPSWMTHCCLSLLRLHRSLVHHTWWWRRELLQTSPGPWRTRTERGWLHKSR